MIFQYTWQKIGKYVNGMALPSRLALWLGVFIMIYGFKESINGLMIIGGILIMAGCLIWWKYNPPLSWRTWKIIKYINFFIPKRFQIKTLKQLLIKNTKAKEQNTKERLDAVSKRSSLKKSEKTKISEKTLLSDQIIIGRKALNDLQNVSKNLSDYDNK